MSHIVISVQQEPFDIQKEYQWLNQSDETGAVATFIGKVRHTNLNDKVIQLTLEHYPGMTEKSLQKIAEKACERFELHCVKIIHRIGALQVGDEIVWVGVASVHRKSAFNALDFIMDLLKTSAPFWKKEATSTEERWLESQASDSFAAKRW